MSRATVLAVHRPGVAIALAGCALTAPLLSARAQDAGVVQAPFAALAGCVSSAFERIHPSQVGAVNRPDSIEVFVTEPRGGFLGKVYSGFERRLTVTVRKVDARKSDVEVRPGEAAAEGDLDRARALVRSCATGRARRG